MWIVVVDGAAYGMFANEHEAAKWAELNWPIALSQDLLQIVQLLLIRRTICEELAR